ncbi:MAG TPA: hypothetical protein VFW33_09190 [Gemmataceae bacterium]|nr:hypothetical protein [Gemmataceae bacterium]
MNAAFLIVTTAWIAGADAAAPAAPAAAPVYSVGTGGCAGGGCGSSCYGGCDSCGGCGCESEGFFSKLKGKVHRSGGDCGCGCETEKHFGHVSGHVYATGCGCDSGCDACGGHSSGGLREKLRGLFHRGGEISCGCGGCDTGCGGCAGCGGASTSGVLSPVPGGTMQKEQIGMPKEEPKKLPSGEKVAPEKDKKPGSVQLIPQPVGVPALDAAPAGKSPF